MAFSRKAALTSAAAVGVALLAACAGEETQTGPQANLAPSPGGALVFASHYPLQYFAERLAPEGVTVFRPETDGDPAYWQPTPEQIARLQDADVLLFNGASYEKWAGTVTLPEERIVDTTAAVEDRYITIEESVTHSHGDDEHTHTHEGTAFTTWLDMEIATAQAAAVRNALMGLLPAEQPAIDESYGDLELALQSLDRDLNNVAATIGDRPLIGSHPVYQYLAEGYGLNIEAVHWEPEEMPTEDQWAELDELRSSHNSEIMIWEDTPAPEIVAALEEREIESIVFRPASNPDGPADFISIMRSNIEALESIPE